MNFRIDKGSGFWFAKATRAIIANAFGKPQVLANTTIGLAMQFRCVMVLVCLAGLEASAAELFPLSEVKAGMIGTGRTVFEGRKIEEFQVEILGVLKNVGPKQSIILAKLSGGPLAETGVLAGMSGSPVYLEYPLMEHWTSMQRVGTRKTEDLTERY